MIIQCFMYFRSLDHKPQIIIHSGSYTAHPFNHGMTEQRESLTFVKFHCEKLKMELVTARDGEKLLQCSHQSFETIKISNAILPARDGLHQSTGKDRCLGSNNQCYPPGRFRLVLRNCWSQS